MRTQETTNLSNAGLLRIRRVSQLYISTSFNLVIKRGGWKTHGSNPTQKIVAD